jgi:hypothetical protein
MQNKNIGVGIIQIGQSKRRRSAVKGFVNLEKRASVAYFTNV